MADNPITPTSIGFRKSEREEVKERAWAQRTSVTQLVRDALVAHGALSAPPAREQ